MNLVETSNTTHTIGNLHYPRLDPNLFHQPRQLYTTEEVTLLKCLFVPERLFLNASVLSANPLKVADEQMGLVIAFVDRNNSDCFPHCGNGFFVLH